MSKLSRKAILAVLSLVLTFVALGATTFAWFSLGTTAVVNPFDLEVRGSEGLEIQFGGYDKNGTITGADTQWFSTLNSGRMNAWLTGPDGIFEDGKLEAVTSDNGTTFSKLEDVTSDGTVTTTGAVANTDYVEFILNFRTKTPNAHLDITDVVFDSTAHSWEADVNYKNEHEHNVDVDTEATVENLYVHYAARMSVTGAATTTTFQAPNPESGTNIGFDLDKGAHNYVAVKHGLPTLVGPDTTHTDYVDGANDSGTKEDIVAFSTDDTGGYYTASVTIRVWIEGWDGNAYDALFDKNFSLAFKFELKTTTP